MKGNECIKDAMMLEPTSTWKTSPRQIRLQTLKAKSNCTATGGCSWRSMTSQATLPWPRKMLLDVPLGASMVPEVAGR